MILGIFRTLNTRILFWYLSCLASLDSLIQSNQLWRPGEQSILLSSLQPLVLLANSSKKFITRGSSSPSDFVEDSSTQGRFCRLWGPGTSDSLSPSDSIPLNGVDSFFPLSTRAAWRSDRSSPRELYPYHHRPHHFSHSVSHRVVVEVSLWNSLNWCVTSLVRIFFILVQYEFPSSPSEPLIWIIIEGRILLQQSFCKSSIPQRIKKRSFIR